MASEEPGQRFHWHYNELDDKNFQLHGKSSILVAIVVFSALFLFTLLCLYVRWSCGYRRREAAVSQSEHRPAASGQPPVASGGLEQAAIAALPVLVVDSAADDLTRCSICLCNLAAGQKVKRLPGCGHGFHPECVDEWLKGQSNCPLCRASLIPSSAPHGEALV